MVCLSKASKEGILIKGSDYIDSLKELKEIVFDKTGTLTKGEFNVEKITKLSKYTEDEILNYAAIGESFSNHPIAKSILRSAKKDIDTSHRREQYHSEHANQHPYSDKCLWCHTPHEEAERHVRQKQQTTLYLLY